MSAIVCGKRSFFEDIESACASPTAGIPPAYKRFRCSSSTSPVRFNYSPPLHPNPVDQLKTLFPNMEVQFIERALEESAYDINSAIKLLQELHLGYSKCSSGSTIDENANIERGATQTVGDAIPLEEPQVQNNLPVDGVGWVDLLVEEMRKATSIDDGRSRAANILENLEKSMSTRVSTEATQTYHKENVMLKEQLENLLRNNFILKRAVAIQHERQKDHDEKNQEVHQLKQLVTQYQEQLRTLEMNNYALQLHLRQAENSNSIPVHFNPDVF